MSLSDPVIFLECNECGQCEELTLTTVAGGWDARTVKKQIERLGFVVDGDDVHYCADCAAERDNARAAVAQDTGE